MPGRLYIVCAAGLWVYCAVSSGSSSRARYMQLSLGTIQGGVCAASVQVSRPFVQLRVCWGGTAPRLVLVQARAAGTHAGLACQPLCGGQWLLLLPPLVQFCPFFCGRLGSGFSCEGRLWKGCSDEWCGETRAVGVGCVRMLPRHKWVRPVDCLQAHACCSAAPVAGRHAVRAEYSIWIYGCRVMLCRRAPRAQYIHSCLLAVNVSCTVDPTAQHSLPGVLQPAACGVRPCPVAELSSVMQAAGRTCVRVVHMRPGTESNHYHAPTRGVCLCRTSSRCTVLAPVLAVAGSISLLLARHPPRLLYWGLCALRQSACSSSSAAAAAGVACSVTAGRLWGLSGCRPAGVCRY